MSEVKTKGKLAKIASYYMNSKTTQEKMKHYKKLQNDY